MKEEGVAHTMKRRELLASSGAILATGSLGGCLARYRDVAGGTGETTTTEETPTEETTEGTTTEETTTEETTTEAVRLADRTFTLTDGGCGEPKNEASVTFDEAGTSVGVTGTIAGSNTCYIAELADASYDSATGTLEVAVVSKEKEGAEVCGQCIVAIDYEATFDFEGGLPATVSVVHASLGEKKTVAKAKK